MRLVLLRRMAVASWMLLLLTPTPVSACSCIGGIPTCQSIWSATAVLEATVDEIGPHAGPVFVPEAGPERERLIRLRDVRAWIGEPVDTLVTAASTDACGYAFKKGIRYVIIAHRRAADGRLVASSCGKKSLSKKHQTRFVLAPQVQARSTSPQATSRLLLFCRVRDSRQSWRAGIGGSYGEYSPVM